jgi:hypothetical protein
MAPYPDRDTISWIEAAAGRHPALLFKRRAVHQAPLW